VKKVWLPVAAVALLAGSTVLARSASAQLVPPPTIITIPPTIITTTTTAPAPPPLAASPSQVSFGSVPVGSSVNQVVTLTNVGPSEITVDTVTTPAAPFGLAANSCTGVTLKQTASCTVTFSFAPPSPTTFQSGVRVDATYRRLQRSVTTSIGLFGTGATSTTVPPSTTLAPRPSLTIAPNPGDYGSTALGVPKDLGFTVTNNGNVALTPNAPAVAISGGQAGEFAITGTSCGPLNPGQACIVGVRFTPVAEGQRTSSLVASYRTQAAAAVQNVQATARLVGAGSVAPVVALSITPPQSLYPETLLGQVAPAQVFQVRNTGNVPNAIASVTMTGANPGDFPITNGCAGANLAPNQTCDLTVPFQPTDVGPRTATIDVRGAAGSSAVAQLGGTGARKALAIEPASADFGTSVVGTAAAPQNLLVRNTGTVALLLDAPVIDGVADFAITSTDCPGLNLAPNATCTVTVTATAAEAGARQALLRASSAEVQASAGLIVTGTFQPVLVMEPPVVKAGYVTTAVGTNFPRNGVVRLGWAGGPASIQVTTDAEGRFRVPVLVLRHERLGPRTMVAEDQPGAFSGVTAPAMVTVPTFEPSGLPQLHGRIRLISRG